MAVTVDIKALLEAGVHFGHKTSRWHPKMAPYIHSKRQENHIIDLTKTVEGLNVALPVITETVAKGKQVLLVGTKRQAKDLVKKTAEEVEQPYVSERWLGGALTNASTVGGQIKHLKSLERRMDSGELENRYNKLEVQRFQEEIADLKIKYGGIQDMNGKPGVVFVTDVIADANAVREANKLNIPVVAIVDTNANPENIDYVIPANDDSMRAINIYVTAVADAIIDAQNARAGGPAAADEFVEAE